MRSLKDEEVVLGKLKCHRKVCLLFKFLSGSGVLTCREFWLVLGRVVAEKDHVVLFPFVDAIWKFSSFVVNVSAVFVIEFDELLCYLHPMDLFSKESCLAMPAWMCCAMLCYAMPCHAMPCHAMLCCAMLYAINYMLYAIMPSYAVLCYDAMLC